MVWEVFNFLIVLVNEHDKIVIFSSVVLHDFKEHTVLDWQVYKKKDLG